MLVQEIRNCSRFLKQFTIENDNCNRRNSVEAL